MLDRENQGLSASRITALPWPVMNMWLYLMQTMSGNLVSSKLLMGKIMELPDDFGLVACLDYKIGINGETYS